MLLLGLFVLAVGVALILSGLFASDVSADGQVDLLGVDVTPATLFVLGVIGGAAVLWGLWLSKLGVRREWRQRREQKKLDELSQKLGRAEAGRNRDLDEDEPKFI